MGPPNAMMDISTLPNCQTSLLLSPFFLL